VTTAYYVRVSTDKQDPQRQIEEIRDYLDVPLDDVQAYADIASGATDNREDFQELWSAVEAGDVDRVVAYEMSRLSRRLSTAAEFMETCAEQGVALETINDMFPNLRGGGEDDIWDELMAKFSAWMMEFEREMTRERVRSGVQNAIDAGKWVGRPPYGFETDEDGYLRVQPDQYIRMQLAIEEALFGDGSVNAISEEYRVPGSTLNRVVSDEDRRRLYLYGEADDERLGAAVDEADVEAEATVSELEQRLSELETRIED